MDAEYARVGLLWTSAMGMSLGYLSLPHNDGESRFGDLQTLVSLEHPDAVSSSLFLTGFSIAAIAYTVASYSIYVRAEKLASKAIVASLLLLTCQMVWAPSLMTGTERLLVLLPLSMSVGLSWAEFSRQTISTTMACPGEKL